MKLKSLTILAFLAVLGTATACTDPTSPRIPPPDETETDPNETDSNDAVRFLTTPSALD